jgi:hypothetical protein
VSATKLFRRLASKKAFAPRSTDEAAGAFESNLTRLTFFRKKNWRPASPARDMRSGCDRAVDFGELRATPPPAGPDTTATRAAHAANRAVQLAAGLLGLAGLVCLAAHSFFGLGVGGMQRVIAYPFTLWIACMGAWLLLRGGLVA